MKQVAVVLHEIAKPHTHMMSWHHTFLLSLVAHNFSDDVAGKELSVIRIPKMTYKCHNLKMRTFMKDQSAASLTVHILETLGVIRQLLILLRN
jgi:hypothetical protein